VEFDYAVEQIMSRVRELRLGVVFTYDEVNEWLKISSGGDLMWAYDKLSDRLIMEHSICLELKKDWIITGVPDDSDIKAAEKRNIINLNNIQ
jgi:hypothetical protein